MTGGGFTGRATFTDREQYHAQLAYEAGPVQSYRGWPFGSLGGLGGSPEPPLPPIVVVD